MALIIGDIELVLIIVLFISFILIMNKTIKLLMNIMFISAISAIFPFFANSFFGFSFPIELNTFLTFIAGGLCLYLFYFLVKIIYSILSVTEKFSNVIFSPFKKDKTKELEKKIKNLENEK